MHALEAVATAQQALALSSSQSNSAVADALEAQLALYRGGSPYRDASRTRGGPAKSV
jgi:hypothetical protein